MLTLERYTFGVGDRFAHQAAAQLRAFQQLAADGVEVIPVWNKSNREHVFVGSEPASVLAAARNAVQRLGWQKPWHVDADHIRRDTVERFLDCSDMFTIDVADSIGRPAAAADVAAAVKRHAELTRPLTIPGISEPLPFSPELLTRIVQKYLLAVQEAAATFQAIAERKGGAEQFIAEVSLDETDTPQTPPELLVILALLADQGVRLQTIAPKFTGRFNKGVDYVGPVAQFEREFLDDLAVLSYAVSTYGLPANLKLSVHSGSDKFTLYPIIRRALARTGAGLHLKTAGTTWLEELIGLSEAGGEGLAVVKEIYAYAVAHVEELCAPYAAVIDIDRAGLPAPDTAARWDGDRWANTIRHVPQHPHFNPHVRQLLHVSFKLAAQHGRRYVDLLEQHAEIIGRNVTINLYERHLRPLFVG